MRTSRGEKSPQTQHKKFRTTCGPARAESQNGNPQTLYFASIIIALCSMTAEGIKIQEPKRFHAKKIYSENFIKFLKYKNLICKNQ